MSKDQVEIPNKTVGTAGDTSIQNLRFQSYKDKDEIHVHGSGGLKFVYRGKRLFQLGMDLFIRSQQQYGVGDNVVIFGEDWTDPSMGKDTPANLVLNKTPHGWEFELVDRHKDLSQVCGEGYDIICDKNIGRLDEFIQRI